MNSGKEHNHRLRRWLCSFCLSWAIRGPFPRHSLKTPPSLTAPAPFQELFPFLFGVGIKGGPNAHAETEP